MLYLSSSYTLNLRLHQVHYAWAVKPFFSLNRYNFLDESNVKHNRIKAGAITEHTLISFPLSFN